VRGGRRRERRRPDRSLRDTPNEKKKEFWVLARPAALGERALNSGFSGAAES